MPTVPNPTATTAEQLLSLRDPGRRHELVRGQLRVRSPAGYWHGGVGMLLAERLARHVREHALGAAFLAETGFLLARDPDTVRAADIAFVRQDRLPRTFATGYFPGAPDLAVEITSPNDSFTEVHGKALSWLDHGARMVWVVDPVARRATVYRGPHDVRVLTGAEEFDGGDVVPGFAMPVQALWPDSWGGAAPS